ncbi:MAG: hypothetical protein SGCHY_000337 [Lobulomycetales sp.]
MSRRFKPSSLLRAAAKPYTRHSSEDASKGLRREGPKSVTRVFDILRDLVVQHSTSERAMVPVESKSELEVFYTGTASEIESWVERHILSQGTTRIGFDVEMRPAFRKGQKQNLPATIQLCVRESHEKFFALVAHVHHVESFDDLRSFVRVFSDPLIRKAGVNVTGDSKMLSSLFASRSTLDHCIKGLVDLAPDSQLLAFQKDELDYLANPRVKHFTMSQPPAGLKSILQRWCSLEPAFKTKRITLSNWEKSPLDELQIKYAAGDAWAGLFASYEIEARKSHLVSEWQDIRQRYEKRVQEEKKYRKEINELKKKNGG